MALVIGYGVLAVAFAVLCATLLSIDKLADKHLTAGERWRQLFRIYLFGSYFVTGQPIRASFGVALTLSVILLYPASFFLEQEARGGSWPLLVLARGANGLGQLCAWPGLAFFVDSTTVSVENKGLVGSLPVMAASALAVGLLALHPMAVAGLWLWEFF